MTPSLVLFWILAIVSVGAAVLMVANQNPVRSALSLVVTFLAVAVFYVTLSAQFIAAVQIIVYAGAIMVLFLFVIMLLNLGAPHALRETGRLQTGAALILAVLFVVLLLASRSLFSMPESVATQAQIDAMGTVQSVGLSLYDPKQPWLFPFEVTSILLLVAVVGAIIMAKRRISD
jgi:NADH-quinone oxidoreductase subunit J